MIFEASDFIFEPPKEVAFARRVLIKPSASCPQPHPITTSRETLAAVIDGIRKVSTADILLLEKSAGPETVHSIYQTLGYDFPRTILLDVDQCVPVAVENTLARPFSQSTFWVPNVILSCDFLITIAPFKVIAGGGDLSIKNLLGLLPTAKYQSDSEGLMGIGQNAGIDNVIADLYFTLPFDLGIVDGRKKLNTDSDPVLGEVEDYGKVFVGAPYEADYEASRAAGVATPYLDLIRKAKAEQGG
ncbi:MAG: DUF362 domain-containing protein [Dehalococcoidia bacterium]